ncbi:DUF7684 family protein [Roseateles chitinivorans]|uniref:DUF7684 family protein n=1 Tax=Roseateles chitinivorans TaxID=2917965 RepID=UPI003D66C49B
MRDSPMDGRSPIYQHVDPDAALPVLGMTAPFRAVIVAELPVTNSQQNRISDWLVAQGCLYAMAWGVNASSWDDAIDWAAIAKTDFAQVSEGALVLTTWHDDETLSEVFDFAIRCASHPAAPLNELIIVHVAGASDPERIQAAYPRSASQWGTLRQQKRQIGHGNGAPEDAVAGTGPTGPSVDQPVSCARLAPSSD